MADTTVPNSAGEEKAEYNDGMRFGPSGVVSTAVALCKRCERYSRCSHLGDTGCEVMHGIYKAMVDGTPRFAMLEGGDSPQGCNGGEGGYGGSPEGVVLVHSDGSKGTGGHEEVVDDPSHYKAGTFEVIDEMILVFGLEATINFCVLNAWKYRARAPYKGKTEQDMEKADRYMQYAHDLMLKQKGRDRVAGKLPLLKADGRTPVSNQKRS